MKHTRMMGLMVAGMFGMALAASPVSAHEHGDKKDPGKSLEMLTKKLKLTDEQRGQVDQIMQDYHSKMEALHEQIEALHNEKHEKIKAVLTPEQQAKFDEMQDKMKDHKKDKKHGKDCDCEQCRLHKGEHQHSH